jgi:hypothetical protein
MNPFHRLSRCNLHKISDAILYFSILLYCIVQCLLQIMFPSACSFIVFWFSLHFTACFGLHGHLQVCRILHIFIFICLKDSALLLFWLAAFFSRGHTLHVFHLCFVPMLFSFLIFVMHRTDKQQRKNKQTNTQERKQQK